MRLGRRIFDNIQKAMGYILAVIVHRGHGAAALAVRLALVFFRCISFSSNSSSIRLFDRLRGRTRSGRDAAAAAACDLAPVRWLDGCLESAAGAGILVASSSLWLGASQAAKELPGMAFTTIVLGTWA